MKAVTFVTLFLGLTAGVQTVQVAVDQGVERVELAVDGEVVQELTAPSWRAAIDLGRELAPHLLRTVAFDGEGRELGRAERWLNLSSRRGDARLWVEHDDSGRAVRGGLTWESYRFRSYRSLLVTLDGEPLAVDDPRSFDLPPHDPDRFHVLSAEVGLPDGTSLHADAAFGGRFGDEMASELTGVPVSVDRRRRLRRLEDAGPWLRVDGEPRPVLALDAGGADLYVVLDRSAHDPLVELGWAMAHRLGTRATVRTVEDEDGEHEELVVQPPVRESPLRQLGLHPDDRMFLVHPVPEPSEPGYVLFGVSKPLTDRSGGTAWQLTYRRIRGDGGAGPQLLAEAVATIGMLAAGSGRPRAVLLILGPRPEDESEFTPLQARRYLRRMRVPLEVWLVGAGEPEEDAERDAEGGAEGDTEGDAAELRRRRLQAARCAWGDDVRDVGGLDTWLDANRRLQRRLERQRVLWIEGIHPPSRVELADAPGWLSMVE